MWIFFYKSESRLLKLSFSSVSLCIFHFLLTCQSLPTLYHQFRSFFLLSRHICFTPITHCHFLTPGNPNSMHSGLLALLHFPMPAPLPNRAQSAITSPSQEPGVIFKSTPPLTTDTTQVLSFSTFLILVKCFHFSPSTFHLSSDRLHSPDTNA